MPVTRVSRLGIVNVFLVQEDDGLTVIDTAIPRSAKAIMAAARELGAPIRRIALTHAHGDHIGSLDELAGELGDVEVLISARDARLLGGDKSLDPGEEGKLRGSYPGAKTQADADVRARRADRLARGRRLPGPHAGPRRVPRHPRPHALLRRRRTPRWAASRRPPRSNPRFPLPALATWNADIELQSARELRALDPARLAPGHGKVVESPAAAMDAAIARGT